VRSRAAIGAGLALALALAAAPAGAAGPANENGDAGRSGPHPRLLAAGAATLVVSYAPALAVAATSDRRADRWLYAPVIGPMANVVDRRCTRDCRHEHLFEGLVVVDAVLQAAGAVQIAASLFMPPPVFDDGTTTVAVSPARLPSGAYGWTATARF
jgi:hypothetical protein